MLRAAIGVLLALVLGASAASAAARTRHPAPPEATAAPVAVATAAVATGAAGSNAEATAAERFASANAAFAAGRYDESIAGFRAIIAESGYSPALLFDLGNAYFRAGRLGEAILWYERARLLAPGDPDVQANLRQARRAANLPPEEEPHWLRFAAGASVNSLAILASGALVFAAAAAIAARIGRAALRDRSGLRRGLTSAIAACFVVAVGAALLCATRLRDLERAVVLGPEAALLVAPYDAATASGSLDPGEIVVIDQRHQEYALVRSAGGRSGWVRGSEVERILPD